jgi:hypothetical protein
MLEDSVVLRLLASAEPLLASSLNVSGTVHGLGRAVQPLRCDPPRSGVVGVSSGCHLPDFALTIRSVVICMGARHQLRCSRNWQNLAHRCAVRGAVAQRCAARIRPTCPAARTSQQVAGVKEQKTTGRQGIDSVRLPVRVPCQIRHGGSILRVPPR